MLQSPTEVSLSKGSMQLKPCQYIVFNSMVKRNQYYDEIMGTKYRYDKSTSNMQQVIQADMERVKTNKIYDRRLKRDLNGPKGLAWQCKLELQRLRSDERGVERDLIRLNRDLAKISLHSLSRSPTLSRNQTSRLSSIAEENSSIPIIEKPKLILGRSSTLNTNRTSMNHLIPIPKRSSMLKRNPYNEQLPKHSLQQVIAKTSDDQSYLQHHTHIINQQKRLVEQKLKQFLH